MPIGPHSAPPPVSLAHCRRVVLDRARNFAYALRLLPEPERSGLDAIYAWMREGDDIVDDTRLHAAKFAEFRDRSLAILDHDAIEPDGDTHWAAFAWAMRSFPIDDNGPRGMLDGLEWDTRHVPLRTREELLRYCTLVGGTVGLCCIGVWRARDAATAKQLAISRGQLLQLVNVVRDIGEDARASPRRVYIPAQLLEAHSLSIEELVDWRDVNRCTSCVREITAMARERLRSSQGLEKLLEPRFARVLWALTAIYVGVLEVLEREPERAVRGARATLSAVTKAGIAARALCGLYPRDGHMA